MGSEINDKVAFVSGHLDLTEEEFKTHYIPGIDDLFASGYSFVTGDARGADYLAQKYLLSIGASCVVYHMFTSPRNNAGFETCGDFTSDEERDEHLTAASSVDVAWVRAGREKSGTAKNLLRRKN
jgi:hypothetical protein